MMPHPFEQQQQEFPLYQVDAFTNQLFAGNPAAVCLLPRWLDDGILQQIAAENNLSETAFCVRNGYLYEIRWFTPTTEVDLCGHATLATAHVLFQHENVHEEQIIFQSKGGELRVRRTPQQTNLYVLNFPQDVPQVLVEVPALLCSGLGESVAATAFLKARQVYVVVLDKEQALRALSPRLADWRQLEEVIGVLVTAPGNITDFVSRCFFPQSGIDEDPVTGSAYTALGPYWAQQTGKNQLTARQLSARGGEVRIDWQGNRVEISGQARTYLKGSIVIY